MTMLAIKAFARQFFLLFAMAALLFTLAGTLHDWQAWTFLAVYFISSFAIILYLLRKDPELLERRLGGGPLAEKQTSQRIIKFLTSIGFIGVILIPAFDRRFSWSQLPASVALAGDALVALGWLAIFFVFRENSFTSAAIALAPGQKVISTGPYALVRHPMYAGSFVMLVGSAMALGSWHGVLVVVALIPVRVWRIIDEEKFLARHLPGYVAYQEKVRYRLIPLVW